jgi:hypothetical protein
MSELEVQPIPEPVAAPAGLSQWQRVAYTFSAPSKTFEDIKRGNKSWWLPYIILIAVGYIFFAAVTVQVSWPQVAENVIHMDAKSADKMAQMPPDQRATAMKFTAYAMEGGFAASPIIVAIIFLIGTLVLWGTINFVFGGKATFSGVFVVFVYGSLPGIIKSLLGTVVLFAGTAPESFNLNNFAPTNIGAFLSPSETNAALYKLATALDFTTIWSLVVTAIGLAIVAGVKRSSGYIAVFGWWALIVLLTVGWAAAFS